MAFKPVNKEEMKKDLTHVNVQLELMGDKAIAFKKICDDIKISGKDLARQMAEYCLDEAAKDAAKK